MNRQQFNEQIKQPSSDETTSEEFTSAVAAPRATLSQRLYGIAKFDGDPPTDEELRDDYVRYLEEKYLGSVREIPKGDSDNSRG